MPEIPRYADTVVLGGGTAGAAVAGILTESTDQSVVLLEAGPDYGPYEGGAWPADLLDARRIVKSHQWGYQSGSTYPDRTIQFDRAKVIGGCSSHNGCAAIWGSRLDYDNWAALGCDGWSTEDLLPLFQQASERLRVRIPTSEEVQPYQRAFLEAAPGAGIPVVEDLNDFDQDLGIAASPVNIWNGIRWNASFAYLDPVRSSPRLTVIGNALVERVTLTGNRATGVRFHTEDGPHGIEAARVVISAGTYESPAILMRSGIGPNESLAAIGVQTEIDRRGVGDHLHDHPAIELAFEGSERLIQALTEFMEHSWLPEEQTIAKAKSRCASEGFDLHLYPVGSPYGELSPWTFVIPVACMTPLARGRVSLTSADPAAHPLLEHGYLGDEQGHDRMVLIDGIAIARELVAQPELSSLIGAETRPGAAVRSENDLAAWIDRSVVHYYHPVGTCKMGPDSDERAVVDPRGRVHGTDNLYVADCSIMPVIPRANTNIPAVVIGERIARWLAEQS